MAMWWSYYGLIGVLRSKKQDKCSVSTVRSVTQLYYVSHIFYKCKPYTDSQHKARSKKKKGLQVVLQVGAASRLAAQVTAGPKAATETGQGSAALFPMSAGGQ